MTIDGFDPNDPFDADIENMRESFEGDDPTIRLVIPGTPPSVNHYKVKTKRGHTYVTAEALKFKADIGVLAAGQSLCNREKKSKNRYAVTITVYLGAKQKSDLDNLAKIPMDALKDALIIHSDDAVDCLLMHKFRDRENPRTVITVSVIGGSK